MNLYFSRIQLVLGAILALLILSGCTKASFEMVPDESSFRWAAFGSREIAATEAFWYSEGDKTILVGRIAGNTFDSFRVEWEGKDNVSTGTKAITPEANAFLYQSTQDIAYEITEPQTVKISFGSKKALSGQMDFPVTDPANGNTIVLECSFSNIRKSGKYLPL